MKRVAIFRSDLLRISETFIYEQARALATWKPLLLGLREVKDGLDTPDIQRAVVDAGFFHILNSVRFWFGVPLPALVRLIKKLDVELVHVHFGTDATDIWPSVRAAGLPMVVTLHGYDINIKREWWENGRGGLRRRRYPSDLLKMASDPGVLFVAVSEAIRRRAIEYGIPSKKVIVIYIGVDITRFKIGGVPIEKRKRQILFVGRMVAKKAPLILLRAFAQAYKTVPDAELAMIGDGPLYQLLKAEIISLSIPVRLLGSCRSEEVIREMHRSVALCLPSIRSENGDAEGLPMVIAEAQACGLPVVTTAHSGNQEGINDGVSGFTVPENRVDLLASALIKVLTEREFMINASKAAVLYAGQNFNVVSGALCLASVYESFNK